MLAMFWRLLPGLLACLAYGLAITPAAALQPPLVANADGIAIGGYDPVAYFTEGRAVQGSDRNRLRWNGAVWWFSSHRSRARFAAEPTTFAPQYGGYCAWAASQNRLAPGDPRIWRIVEGRLYFNCSERAQADWEADLQANIARGNANWLRLIGEAMEAEQRRTRITD